MVSLFTGTVPNLTQSQPDFDTNTQAILDYIASLAPELNAWVGAYVQDTSSASSTLNGIGTGIKTFIVEAGKGYKVNMPVRASATTGNYMDGIVTAYSGTSLTINFASSNGSGTFTSWQIFLTVPGSNVTLGSNTFTGDQFVPDEAYDATGWNGNFSVPTKNAVRDKIETIVKNIVDSDTAVKINRKNYTEEGGRLEFARAIDNAPSFYLDTFGGDTWPVFRTVAKNYANSGAESVVQQLDSFGNLSSSILGASGLYPEFKCRGFCNFSGVGSIYIRSYGNVLGIARIGLGDYEVTLATSMPDSSFSCSGSAIRTDQPSNTLSMNAYPIATNKIKIFVNRMSGGANERVDCNVVSLSIFR